MFERRLRIHAIAAADVGSHMLRRSVHEMKKAFDGRWSRGQTSQLQSVGMRRIESPCLRVGFLRESCRRGIGRRAACGSAERSVWKLSCASDLSCDDLGVKSVRSGEKPMNERE